MTIKRTNVGTLRKTTIRDNKSETGGTAKRTGTEISNQSPAMRCISDGLETVDPKNGKRQKTGKQAITDQAS